MSIPGGCLESFGTSSVAREDVLRTGYVNVAGARKCNRAVANDERCGRDTERQCSGAQREEERQASHGREGEEKARDELIVSRGVLEVIES